jgi:hypothetical protein
VSKPPDVSLREAAKRLGLKPSDIYELIARSELDCPNRGVRVSLESLEAFDAKGAAERARRQRPGPWALTDATAERFLGPRYARPRVRK